MRKKGRERERERSNTYASHAKVISGQRVIIK